MNHSSVFTLNDYYYCYFYYYYYYYYYYLLRISSKIYRLKSRLIGHYKVANIRWNRLHPDQRRRIKFSSLS